MELLQDINHGYQEAFGAEDISSPAMKRAILRWLQLYYGGDSPLQLPYTIVRKLTRAIFAEYQSNMAMPHREAMELALIGGESYLKPSPAKPANGGPSPGAISSSSAVTSGANPGMWASSKRPSWAAITTPSWSGGPWMAAGCSL